MTYRNPLRTRTPDEALAGRFLAHLIQSPSAAETGMDDLDNLAAELASVTRRAGWEPKPSTPEPSTR